MIAIAPRHEDFAPMDGLRVLELSTGAAAMFCGRVLGWLGARVERRVSTDGDVPWCAVADDGFGQALLDYCNEGKLPVRLDAESLQRAVAAADLLVTDLDEAALLVAGLDLGTVRTDHPHLVVLSVTGFGLTGPHAGFSATELTTYHAGGEGYLLPGAPVYDTYPDRAPLKAGRFQPDYDAGLAAATAALAALFRRERTGLGDVVEVSAQEVQIGLNRTTLSRCFYEGVDSDRGDRGYDYGGIIRAADGWITLRPTEDYQWESFARAIGRTDLVEDERFATRVARDRHGQELTRELTDWAGARTRAEIRGVILEAGCPGGPFLEMDEVLNDDYLVERDLFAPVSTGGRAPQRLLEVVDSVSVAAGAGPGTEGQGPLAGVRVVDLTWVAAGPYATELLAFLGADVIRVESRERPDLFRRLLQATSQDLDSSIRFVDLNQHKRSICVNLRSEAGKQVFTRLAAQSDVVVDNFRPGVRERLGIGDAQLRADNPRLVSAALSGFGSTGRMRARPGYASVFNAESGLGAMTGYVDGPPTEIRDSNDLRAGTATACAVVAALLERERRGRAASVEVAAREVLTVLQGDAVLEASRGTVPRRSGNALGRLAPYGVWRASCGSWLAVCIVTDQDWQSLVKVIDDGSLLDPSLADQAGRWTARAQVDDAVARWVGDRTADEALEALRPEGIAASVSAPASRILHDPHLRQRGLLTEVEHPRLGRLTVIGAPFRFWRDPGLRPATRSPLLGEHTTQVLTEVASLEADEIATLVADAVVS